MLTRICQQCGRQVKLGEKCACSREERRASHAFYYTAQWKKVAKAARQRAHYLDEYELQYSGRMQEGKIVHHIYTPEERPDLALTLSNLIVVSNRTHEMIHKAYNRGGNELDEMRSKLLAIRRGQG
jgi:hypothetical protein